MRYIAVIFDMDGTILDTLDDLAGSVNHSLALYGYPLRSRDEIRSFLGNGMIRLIHLSVPEGISKEQEEAVLNEHKSYYPMHSGDMTKPYDGIVDLLSELKNRGIKTAVVSNKSDANVKALVSQFFDGLFDVSIGSMEGVARKPAADMVNMALERLGVSKEDAIYIGDSEVDLNTAKNSQLDMITVTWGFRDRDHLIQTVLRFLLIRRSRYLICFDCLKNNVIYNLLSAHSSKHGPLCIFQDHERRHHSIPVVIHTFRLFQVSLHRCISAFDTLCHHSL